MRKFLFGVVVNLVLSFALSFTVTVATNTYNGLPINPSTVLMPLLWGTLIGTITTTIIPVNKIGIKFATLNNAGPETGLCALYKNFVILAIMVPIMNFFVTGIMIGFFTQEFFNAWLCPIATVYPVGYVTSLIIEPIGMFVARKLTGFDPMAASAEARLADQGEGALAGGR